MHRCSHCHHRFATPLDIAGSRLALLLESRGQSDTAQLLWNLAGGLVRQMEGRRCPRCLGLLCRPTVSAQSAKAAQRTRQATRPLEQMEREVRRAEPRWTLDGEMDKLRSLARGV